MWCISRDERFGQDDWHQRAVDAYYLQTGPLLGKMRAEISTLLRLAPRANYESFLRLYEDEMLALDSCLLELMKIEAASSGWGPAAVRLRGERGEVLPGHPGTHWRPVYLEQDLADSLDREFASLAKAFVSKDRLTSVPGC